MVAARAGGHELGLAVLAIVFAPKLAATLVPFGVLGLAVFGLQLAKMYRDGFTNQVQYVFIHAGPDTWDAGAAPVLAEAVLLFAVGLWLLLRLDAPGARPARALAARWLTSGRGGLSARHGLLLIPVAGLAMQLLGPGNWFGFQAVDGLDAALLDLAATTAALVLIFRSRAWAATLAATCMTARRPGWSPWARGPALRRPDRPDRPRPFGRHAAGRDHRRRRGRRGPRGWDRPGRGGAQARDL